MFTSYVAIKEKSHLCDFDCNMVVANRGTDLSNLETADFHEKKITE